MSGNAVMSIIKITKYISIFYSSLSLLAQIGALVAMMHQYQKPYFFKIFPQPTPQGHINWFKLLLHMINRTQGNSTQQTNTTIKKMQSKFPENVTTYSGKETLGRYIIQALLRGNNCTVLGIVFLWHICSSNKSNIHVGVHQIPKLVDPMHYWLRWSVRF